MAIQFTFHHKEKYIASKQWEDSLIRHQKIVEKAILGSKKKVQHANMLGWMDFKLFASNEELDEINTLSKSIRENYDVLVISGVGGSIQATLAVIQCLKTADFETVILGNTLSARAINSILKKIKNKRVYFINIAKNFGTLEPGIGFRFMTDYLKATTECYAQHVSVIGTKHSELHKLAEEEGFRFWPFYDEIGGRYSGLSVVSLLPLAINNISIEDYIEGAKSLQEKYRKGKLVDNPSYQYALARFELYKAGKDIELFAHFEPFLEHVAKWCVQLFAESEGKENKGIFPTRASYSEDLHAIGQYVQEGQRKLFETFLHIDKLDDQLQVPVNEVEDGFSYIEGKLLKEINDIAYRATIAAHDDANVPCLVITLDELDAKHIGELFYFFMVACYMSSMLLDVNPFDQQGVEAYKSYMFTSLEG